MSEEQMEVDTGGGRRDKVKVDYPSNSKKARQEPPPKEVIEPVVTGAVVKRKRSLVARIFGDFVAEDSSTVFGFLWTEVLLPAAKTMMSDTVSQGMDRILYGESKPRPAGRPGFTSYGNRYVRPHVVPDTRPSLSRQARATHDFTDIIIGSRGEAEDVLDRMRDLINTYEVATVSDLYDLVGLTGEFTDDKWGWSDLRSASVRPVRGGYMLHLPRTQPMT